MDKTPFSNRCGLLSALWFFYSKEEEMSVVWKDFFDYADIGLPLAYMVDSGIATAQPEGEKIINETWEALCALLDIDPTADYNTLQEMFEESEDEEG